MKIREKRKISPLMKFLIVMECIAVALLMVLCLVKNSNSDILSFFHNEEVDVVLDAGHGGYDTGATDGNLKEKDITIAMAKRIGEQLEAKGYRVAYTREDDEVDFADNESDDLKYRVNFIQEKKPKLFVSIHVNSQETNMDAYGYEIWGKIKDEQVFHLSKNILDQVGSLGYSQNRGMKDQDLSPLYILENTYVPGVLFEVGFISNANDQSYMVDGSARNQFCDKITQGIVQTLEEMKQTENEKS